MSNLNMRKAIGFAILFLAIAASLTVNNQRLVIKLKVEIRQFLS